MIKLVEAASYLMILKSITYVNMAAKYPRIYPQQVVLGIETPG